MFGETASSDFGRLFEACTAAPGVTWAQAAIPIMGLIAAIISFTAYGHSRKTARRHHTLTFLLNQDSHEELQEALKDFLDLRKSERGLTVWAEKEHYGTPQSKAITRVLNHLEFLSVGVMQGTLDYWLIHRLRRSNILGWYDAAEGYIRRLNELYGKENKQYWSELTALVERLKKHPSGTKPPWWEQLM